MIGFLLSGALAGLAGLAWPLYLHLFRNRKPQVETVPSLLLFALERRRNRRRRLSDLLLLLARLLILAALCLLLARPYLRTQRLLPLPSLAHDPRVLGVVLDTSLRALGRDEGGTRFDRQRTWLTQRLSGLPPDVAVAVATTTQPMAAPVLSSADAIRLLESMRPVPLPGNANEAVRVLQEQTAGIPALFCVVASRDEDLWPDDDHEGRVLIYDTTEIASPRGILRALPDPLVPQALDCELFGYPVDVAQAPALVLHASDGRSMARALTGQESLQRRLRISLDGFPGATVSGIEVAGAEGPWDRWHLLGERATAANDECWLVVDRSAPSQTAKALVVAALQAVRPDLQLRVVAPGALLADGLATAPSRVVLLALAAPSEPVAALVRSVTAGGGRVLAICPPTGGDLAGMLQWGECADRPERRLVPTERAEGWFPAGSLELSGLAGLAVPRVRLPSMDGGGVVLAQSGDGAVVVGAELGAGRLLAMGVPADLGSDSPVFHPVYPHLLAALVTDAEPRSHDGGWCVGAQPTAAELFSLPAASGQVVSPVGKSRPVAAPSARVFLDVPGVWRLEREGGSVEVAVNYPRPALADPLSRADWSARHPRLQATWATEDIDLSDPALYVRAGRRERSYDASPVAALLLLVGLVVEGLLRLVGGGKGGGRDG